MLDFPTSATANFYTFHGHLSVLVADSRAQLAQLEAIRAGLENWIVKCAVPDIETKLAGRTPDTASSSRSEQLMANVRQAMDDFTKPIWRSNCLPLPAAVRR